MCCQVVPLQARCPGPACQLNGSRYLLQTYFEKIVKGVYLFQVENLRIKGSLWKDKPDVGDSLSVSSLSSPNKFEVLRELGEKSESDIQTRITHRGGLSHEASVMVGSDDTRINQPGGRDNEPSRQISNDASPDLSHQLKGLQGKGRTV